MDKPSTHWCRLLPSTVSKSKLGCVKTLVQYCRMLTHSIWRNTVWCRYSQPIHRAIHFPNPNCIKYAMSLYQQKSTSVDLIPANPEKIFMWDIPLSSICITDHDCISLHPHKMIATHQEAISIPSKSLFCFFDLRYPLRLIFIMYIYIYINPSGSHVHLQDSKIKFNWPPLHSTASIVGRRCRARSKATSVEEQAVSTVSETPSRARQKEMRFAEMLASEWTNWLGMNHGDDDTAPRSINMGYWKWPIYMPCLSWFAHWTWWLSIAIC